MSPSLTSNIEEMNLTYRAVNQFIQFLEFEPDPDYGYLSVEKCGDHVNLRYDTCDHTCSGYYRARLPRARYRGAANTLFLQLIEGHSFTPIKGTNNNESMIYEYALETMIASFKSKRIARQRFNRLQALTAANYDTDAAHPMEPLPGEQSYNCPQQLLRSVKQMVSYLNEDNCTDLEHALKHVQRRYFNDRSVKRAELLANVVDYPFDDGVNLKRATDAHFRPFTFAGWWMDFSILPSAPLRIGIAMYDTRRPGCLLDMSIQERFTDELCLFMGLEHLQLAPSLRSRFEEFGQPHPNQKGLRLISTAELAWEFGE
jgi:hypothetical protein